MIELYPGGKELKDEYKKIKLQIVSLENKKILTFEENVRLTNLTLEKEEIRTKMCRALMIQKIQRNK